MARISFKRHRFPAEVIRHAVWLYFRFTLSFRDIEELMAQRGVALEAPAGPGGTTIGDAQSGLETDIIGLAVKLGIQNCLTDCWR